MENPLEITIPYKVGFKRPPNHTRFQKGLSGNPEGRTREIRPLEAALSKVIFRRAGSKDDKKEKPISNLKAMVRSMVQRAIDGDAAAFREVMHLDTILSTAEIYDPRTNTWTDAGPMFTARVEHSVSSLGNGKYLLSGGVGTLSEIFKASH